jgi:hypothetical protein
MRPAPSRPETTRLPAPQIDARSRHPAGRCRHVSSNAQPRVHALSPTTPASVLPTARPREVRWQRVRALLRNNQRRASAAGTHVWRVDIPPFPATIEEYAASVPRRRREYSRQKYRFTVTRTSARNENERYRDTSICRHRAEREHKRRVSTSGTDDSSAAYLPRAAWFRGPVRQQGNAYAQLKVTGKIVGMVVRWESEGLLDNMVVAVSHTA